VHYAQPASHHLWDYASRRRELRRVDANVRDRASTVPHSLLTDERLKRFAYLFDNRLMNFCAFSIPKTMRPQLQTLAAWARSDRKRNWGEERGAEDRGALFLQDVMSV
jgi:hypothetical protein